MRKSKYTEEQIIGFLTQTEAGLAVAAICRKRAVGGATWSAVRQLRVAMHSFALRPLCIDADYA